MVCSEKGTTNMPKSKLLCTAALLSSMLGLPMAANAADLPVRPPAPAPMYAPPPPFSWTGFYIGGNLGAGWNHGNVSDSNNFFNLGVDNSTTFVGGGLVGGNYQFINLVVGVEADFDWFANNNNNSGGGTPFLEHRHPRQQQWQMADHSGWAVWVRRRPLPILWKGWRRMGWEQQSDAAQRADGRHSFLQQRQHQYWLGGWCRCRVGFREQLDGETGV